MPRLKTPLVLRDVDKGWREMRETSRLLSAAKTTYVKVGVMSDARVPDAGISMVELAAIHEFGAPRANIPERSFIRETFGLHVRDYRKKLRAMVQAALLRASTEHLMRAFAVLGAKMVSDIQRRVRSNSPPFAKLAPSTLRAKRSKTRRGSKGTPKPLIETGRMIGSVTYEVVRGGEL